VIVWAPVVEGSIIPTARLLIMATSPAYVRERDSTYIKENVKRNEETWQLKMIMKEE
jgi:hypothetical protein